MIRTIDELETRRFLAAVFFTCLAACSSNSDGSDDGAGAPEPACRSYATQYRVTSTEGVELGLCEFDRPSLTMSCRRAPYYQLTTWRTIADAVAENRPIGFPTRSTDTLVLSSDCSVVHEYAYASSGRLTASDASTTGDSCGGPGVVYDAWDDEDRPTHGTTNGVGILDCMGQDLLLSYDDGTRTVTAAYSGGTSCRDETISLTYDEDGIVISSTYTTPGAEPVVSTFTIEGRSEICTD